MPWAAVHIPVSPSALVATRQRLRRELQATLTSSHRAFLLGLVQGAPQWELMQCGHLAELPAIRWKLQNLAKLKRSSPGRHVQQADELRARFGA